MSFKLKPEDCDMDIRIQVVISCGFILLLLLLSGCKDRSSNPIDRADPDIISVSPTEGAIGSSVVINGTGFGSEISQNRVRFNDVEAEISSAAPNRIHTRVPEGAETGTVSVTVGGITAQGPVFTVLEEHPAITAVVPDSGQVGMEVEVLGVNFGDDPNELLLTFAGIEADIELASDSLLITQVPEGAETGLVELTVGEETVKGPEFRVITPGELIVYTSTEGEDIPESEYQLQINHHGDSQNYKISANDTLRLTGIEKGLYEIELAIAAENCMAVNDNPQTADVTYEDVAEVFFSVECDEIIREGTVEVSIATDGDLTEVNNYTLELRNGGVIESRMVSANDLQFFYNIEIGLYELELSGLPYNCSATGSIPLKLEVFQDEATSVEFLVYCKPILRDRIVFASDRSNGIYNIYVMNSDGTGVRSLTNNNVPERHPVISPDGTKIAFNYGNSVAVMDSDGNNMKILASSEGKPPSTPLITKSDPSWSPDGQKIAYTVHDTDSGVKTIWVMNADGSDQTQLIGNHNNRFWSPDWRPSGDRLIFVGIRVITTDSGMKVGVDDLYVANSDGSGIQLFNSNATGNNTQPRWTSDVSVAFISDRDGNDEVYFFALFGDIALTSGSHLNQSPSGSPDNTRIVFAREIPYKPGAPATYQIMTVSTNADNPDERFLTGNASNDVDPHWSSLDWGLKIIGHC
jgi:Tol biopolymer transport system component